MPLEKPQSPASGSVHDQPTIPGTGNQGTPADAVPGQPAQGQPASGQSAQGYPGAPPAPPGFIPPPPLAPNGPGQSPPGSYGYPSYPGAGAGGQPPGYPGYPGYPGWGAQGGWNTMQQGPANGYGIAALVLGIVGVVVFCAWGLGIIVGSLALIFGILGRKRARRGEANNGGMALAGIILGSVGVVVSAVFLGFIIWAIQQDDDSDPYNYGDDTYSSALVIEMGR